MPFLLCKRFWSSVRCHPVTTPWYQRFFLACRGMLRDRNRKFLAPSGTLIKHFYLTVAKVILCHSHATSLYLNTCYAIYNLQCRIELKSNSLWKRGKIFHERLKNEKNSFIVENPFYLHLTCSRQGKPVILSCLGSWKNISVKNFERSWASLRIKILIERGCSLLRYFDCSIGSYMDFN